MLEAHELAVLHTIHVIIFEISFSSLLPPHITHILINSRPLLNRTHVNTILFYYLYLIIPKIPSYKQKNKEGTFTPLQNKYPFFCLYMYPLRISRPKSC